MIVLCVDPGPKKSGVALLDYKIPTWGEWLDNADVVAGIRSGRWRADVFAGETIQNYGHRVGADVFETMFWLGRFIEAWQGPHIRIKRPTVRSHMCGDVMNGTADVRRALINRYGGPASMKGTKCKRCKGRGWYRPMQIAGGEDTITCAPWESAPTSVLYPWDIDGGHIFSAIAVGLTFIERGPQCGEYVTHSSMANKTVTC